MFVKYRVDLYVDHVNVLIYFSNISLSIINGNGEPAIDQYQNCITKILYKGCIVDIVLKINVSSQIGF